MEVESAKVLDNGRKIVVDMKRKRSARCMAYFTGAACSDARCSARDESPEGPFKQADRLIDSDDCKSSFEPNVKKSLVRNYSNFMKSELPKRVLFYENEEWSDFPESLIGLLIEDFKMRKAAIEVEFRGSRSLFDFLHMILVDLKTGLQQPIAWIDESGSCFFPEIYSANDDLHECFQSGGKESHSILFSDPYNNNNNAHEIKLQLEIEVSTDGTLKMEECTEGSSHIKRLKVAENPNNCEQVRDDVNVVVDTKEVIDESKPCHSLPPTNGKLTSDAVRHMFMKGMGSSFCADDVQYSFGRMADARLELFEKQVEITKKYRGNANVRFAWLPSSKESASKILMHGLGCVSQLPKPDLSFGIGVHLSSLNCSYTSASYCDVDENGVQHMVLCRVILGNMELVRPGSEQNLPSSENFDSGVNDLRNPEHYIIWNMNMATHIYPEYAVSFKKLSPNARDDSDSQIAVSGVTNSSSQEKLQPVSSPVGSVGNRRQIPDVMETSKGRNSGRMFAGRPPKSPWMPFAMLFKAIEDKVPFSKMKLVYQNYSLFRTNKITRDELVQRMRWAVGDALLRAAIISLQGKQGGQELKVPKQEQGTSF
ncbi:hypothetical protein ACHQM5_008092 [Ranunculus cassubicifolius]